MAQYTRLKKLREERDLTQKQVACALFMQLTQYRRYESGERELPLETAIAISKFYNVPIDYLAGISDKINYSKNDLTKEETELLITFRKLSSDDKVKLIRISQVFIQE